MTVLCRFDRYVAYRELASTCVNYSTGSLDQNGGSFRAIADIFKNISRKKYTWKSPGDLERLYFIIKVFCAYSISSVAYYPA